MEKMTREEEHKKFRQEHNDRVNQLTAQALNIWMTLIDLDSPTRSAIIKQLEIWNELDWKSMQFGMQQVLGGMFKSLNSIGPGSPPEPQKSPLTPEELKDLQDEK